MQSSMIEYNNLRLAKDGIQFPASYKTLEKLYQSKKDLLEQLKMKSVSQINQQGIMVGGAVEDTPENRDLFLLEMVHSLSSTVDTLWAFLREIEKKVDKEYNDTNQRITMNYKEMNQKMDTMSKKMEYLPPNTKFQL